MRRLHLSVSLLLIGGIATCISAADTPEFPPPQKEHAWLQQFVGTWELESKASMGPGQPEMVCTGSETVRSIGGFWIVSDLTSEVQQTKINAVLTLGYDPKSRKYVGTWLDSATSYLWNYTGTVDESGKVLTLEAEGPNFMLDGKLTKFRDIHEFKSDDLRVMKSEMKGEDGQWITFMTGEARRKK